MWLRTLHEIESLHERLQTNALTSIVAHQECQSDNQNRVSYKSDASDSNETGTFYNQPIQAESRHVLSRALLQSVRHTIAIAIERKVVIGLACQTL
jgi:hypothetical protein